MPTIAPSRPSPGVKGSPLWRLQLIGQGAALHDERTGKTANYAGRSGVVASFLVLPKKAPPWMKDRSLLWNMAEWVEKRCNSTVARECEVALPANLSAVRREKIVRLICDFLANRYGVAIDVAIHLPGVGDERNHHAHILFSTREVTRDGFGEKTRVLDARKTGKAEVKVIRQQVADIINAELAAAGLKERVDHRSHKDRGIDVPPQIHEGQNARAAARRGKKLTSYPQLQPSGRVVNYVAIDKGGTRAEYNAEIIQLQDYRKKESRGELLARLNAQLADVTGNIEQLQSMLDNTLLSEGTRTRIRVALERIIQAIVFRSLQETEYMRQVREVREAKKQLKELVAYRVRLQGLQQEAAKNYEQQKAQYAAARALLFNINRFPNTLLGIPPYVIRMEIPLSGAFNAVGYQENLRRQSNAELLRVVLSRPAIPDKPALATVALRQDVLQVKELLRRVESVKKENTDTGGLRLQLQPSGI